MYSYIKGKVVAQEGDRIVIENNGIGYEIMASLPTISSLNIGEDVLIYTYFQVKQDGIALLGFISREEKTMFTRLITVTGIGPKSALAILGEISPFELAFAVAKGDSIKLSGVKGIGKKTAARIVLELKEKVDLSENDNFSGLKSNTTRLSNNTNESDDVIVALMSLGFSRSQSTYAVDAVIKEGEVGVENILKKALKIIKR